ncbi:MAG TPA: NAD(P)H-hydrate dehydratase [Bacteroidales bacterium]|nr:NAD(P)H-hydrate dehydratase [Bacteroidales bacterium]
MKILPIEKVRQGDSYTIENEPISDIDLMERAAQALKEWFISHISKDLIIKVFCGSGNNGGDGLALARLLNTSGYHVEACVLKSGQKLSPACQVNYDRLFKKSGVRIYDLTEEDDFPEISGEDIVVDAIFGSGLSRPVKGFPAGLIRHINKNNAVVIAVDVPSGLFCDETNSQNPGAIIEADVTLTFQFPKYAFLFAENFKYVGLWEVLPIGIHEDFIREVEVDNYLIELGDCRSIYKPRVKYAHKGHFGHALLVAGSYGKMGAAVLASKACLRAGAGLLTTHIPVRGYSVLQTAVPEAMVSIDTSECAFSGMIELSNFNAIGVGPGIGTKEETQKALKLLIQGAETSLLFDADAINILATNKTWLSFLPKHCIFTPHPKEFERLVGKSTSDFDRIQLQREFSFRYQSYIILKGAHTSISCPDGRCYFNSTGNPGMATGGSGDVLTGVILGLLAQYYHPKEASILGVYLHGLAGDIAMEKRGMESMIASDIMDNLGEAFLRIRG